MHKWVPLVGSPLTKSNRLRGKTEKSLPGLQPRPTSWLEFQKFPFLPVSVIHISGSFCPSRLLRPGRSPLRNSRHQLPNPAPAPCSLTAAVGLLSEGAFKRLKVNDFRQMISLIKLNASCNYHAGFEECPIPPVQPEG